jgi:sulfate transport system ATP-binding protein
MQLGPAGSGMLDGKVSNIRTFGPIQRAEVALAASDVVIEIDAPRDGNLRIGEMVGLKPRRYRIFAA